MRAVDEIGSGLGTAQATSESVRPLRRDFGERAPYAGIGSSAMRRTVRRSWLAGSSTGRSSWCLPGAGAVSPKSIGTTTSDSFDEVVVELGGDVVGDGQAALGQQLGDGRG